MTKTIVRFEKSTEVIITIKGAKALRAECRGLQISDPPIGAIEFGEEKDTDRTPLYILTDKNVDDSANYAWVDIPTSKVAEVAMLLLGSLGSMSEHEKANIVEQIMAL